MHEHGVLQESSLSLACQPMTLAAPNEEALKKIAKVESFILGCPQIAIQTEHIIHGGMYARTIRLQPGVVITGALIKVPTILVVTGKCSVFTGDGWIHLEGIHIIPASKGRKQIFATSAETTITMTFRTDAKTVEAAEAEFTDEAEDLMSRRQDSGDLFTITGE